MTTVSIALTPSAGMIDSNAWERLAPAGHPFLSADFLETIERHAVAGPGNGWQASHWLLKDGDDTALGLLPTYLKTNSHGDFVRDWSWAGAYEQLGKPYYPKLLSGLPHTPAGGNRFLTGDKTAAHGIRQDLIETVKAHVAENRVSSWHVALPAPDEVEHLRSQGLLVSHDVQFHWHDRGYEDFAAYLARFPSEKRRKIKAERRRVAESGISIEIRHGNEIAPAEWPALHALYAMTFVKYRNYAAFSAACFAELGSRLERRMVVFIAYADGEPVAVSICFRSDDTLYGRYWGTNGKHHSLHFELCFYQGIDYCLKHGLTTFEPGAGGEHKVARGFEPTIVRSCHWIEDQRMRSLIGQYLERHRASVLAYAEEATAHLPLRR